MVSFKFTSKLFLLPFKVVQTTIEYYSSGTIYSKTNAEFKHSLRKNIIIAVESFMASYISKGDIKFFVHKSLTSILADFKSKDIVKKDPLRNFGKKYDDVSYWIVQNESEAVSKNVIVYYHGGGYAVGAMAPQILSLLVMYRCLPKDIQDDISILIVDYSLTTFDRHYPTQISEAVMSYRKLSLDGYENIFLMGDSAGGNLALAVTRYISYPEEAQKEFCKYKEFDFPYIKDPQPRGLILISPWVEPSINTSVKITSDTKWYGDLIGYETDMDKWYIEDVKSFVPGWINFNATTYEKHWSNVKCLRQKGKVIVIGGERELLRDSIENWLHIIDFNSEFCTYEIEKGGIHDCLFQIEVLDYKGSSGSKRAFKKDYGDKFCMTLVIEYIINQVSQIRAS